MIKKERVFVTIFLPSENIHLVKDVGMIPFLLHKNHGYDSYLATYNNDNYEYLENELRGLKVKFVSKIFKNEFLNILMFLFSFRKIHVLQFYHFSLTKLLICFLFKVMTFNKGKTYIKLDANEKLLKQNYSGIKAYLVKFLIKYVDILSAETKLIVDSLNASNTFFKNVVFIPNGFYQSKDDTESYDNKKKQMITVARLDDPGKSILTLVKGFAEFCEKQVYNDWNFILVGPYNDQFKTELEDVLKPYPKAVDKIVLKGPVYNRLELKELYNESRIFLFASLSESFGFVYLEALANRCFIISTPLSPCKEITNNWKYASVFDFNDHKELSIKISQTIIRNDLNRVSQNGQDFVYENYYWPNIIRKINFLLN